jgi:transposase
MIFTRGLRVCLAAQPADLRRGFEGLALLVRGALQEDERSSQIFVFTNKRRDRIRLLYWDGTGLWILTKKLEAGTFAWPKVPEGAAKIVLRVEALEMLLSGIDLKGARLRPWYEDPTAASRLPASPPTAAPSTAAPVREAS